MPEEINRIVTDALSDFLFVTEPSGRKNLLAEGVPEQKVFLTGNVMIDTLLRFRSKAAESDVLERFELRSGNYAVVTLHRPSNVDDPAQLGRLLEVLKAIAASLPVVFPVHPRTRARMEAEGMSAGSIVCAPPLGYLDFLRLMSEARLVLTDSGGIQEETTILQVPCLTLRENTERPATIEQGSNRLVGTNPEAILEAARAVLSESPSQRPARVPDLWDGRASARIVDILEARLRG
jgi:UDP-N-acetylglucosamine 2-epimerase (non-hydrolysing)